MKLDYLKRLVAEHREKQIRFPEETPESFWLGYDAAMYDFLRLLDEQIAWGEKGKYPGDFIIELSPMVPAGRGIFKPAPHKHVINMLPKLIEHVEARVNRWYEMYRPSIKVELSRARSTLAWAEMIVRSLNANLAQGVAAHTENPEYTVDLAEAAQIQKTEKYLATMAKMETLAERARTFIAENIGSEDFKRFPVGKPREHSRSFVEGE